MNTPKTQYARRRRGTVLLLAVGLITIVAILGSTFLVTSLLDARQSEALALKAQAEPLARGAVERLRVVLARDLYPDQRGPYGAAAPSPDQWGPLGTATLSPDQWSKYVDYPSEEIDPHLASAWTKDVEEPTGRWPHVTNLTGAPAADVEQVNPRAAPTALYVDTDGDALKDARLIDTDVRDAEGNRYMMAVRVTDLASRMWVPDEDAPADSAEPMEVCYGIGDEMFLHWHEPNAPTDIGRFYTYVGKQGWPADITANIGHFLTAYNVTRPLVRKPSPVPIPGRPGYQKLIFTSREAGNLELDDADNRRWLYERVKQVAGAGMADIPPDQRERMEKWAAHFVVNLWAYMSPEAAHDRPFAFEYEKGRFAYGLVEQLVLSEAYAYYWAQTDPEDGSLVGQGEAYAMELINPTPEPVDVSNYRFGEPGTPGESFPDTRPVRPGERVVIYSFAGQIPDPAGGDPQDADRDTFGFQPPGWDGDTYWHQAADMDNLNFNVNNLTDIWRAFDDSHTVPVDRLDGDEDLDFNPDPKPPDGESRFTIRDAARDDRPDAMRVTVANRMALLAEYDWQSSDDNNEDNRQDHNLGKANNVPASDPPSDRWGAVYEGFHLHRRNYAGYVRSPDAPLERLGEITRVYLYGPERVVEGDDTTWQSFPHAIEPHKTDPSRGRPDYLTAVETGPRPYPDVPWACLMQELIDLLPPGVAAAAEQRGQWTVGGRLNINTASRELLELLWPLEGAPEAQIPGTELALTETELEDLARALIRYRDELIDLPDKRANDLDYPGAEVPGLRTQIESRTRGFLTPGEAAVPVTRYAQWYLNQNGIDKDSAEYHDARDWFYRVISDHITANSDAYAVNIVIQLQPKPREGEDWDYEKPVNRWQYIAVIDRSTCYGPGALPAVRLFSEVK